MAIILNPNALVFVPRPMQSNLSTAGRRKSLKRTPATPAPAKPAQAKPAPAYPAHPASIGLGRELPRELTIAILEHVPRSALFKLRLVNSAWNTLAQRALAPHATLGLPTEDELRPVPPSKLAILHEHAHLTTFLDVLPHTHCGKLDMPNLETLRLFPTALRSLHSAHLCSGPCSALAALRPRTLVIVSSLRMGDILREIPNLVPGSTLENVEKLILVLPSGEGSFSPVRGQSWARDITLILAISDTKHVLRPVMSVRAAPNHWIPATTRFTVVGASLTMQMSYEIECPGNGARWLNMSTYFKGNGEFSDAETAALRRHEWRYAI